MSSTSRGWPRAGGSLLPPRLVPSRFALEVNKISFHSNSQDRAADPELEGRMREEDEREVDEKEERGCEETRAKAMAWDEWTDEHRRGEGNRKNMG